MRESECKSLTRSAESWGLRQQDAWREYSRSFQREGDVNGIGKCYQIPTWAVKILHWLSHQALKMIISLLPRQARPFRLYSKNSRGSSNVRTYNLHGQLIPSNSSNKKFLPSGAYRPFRISQILATLGLSGIPGYVNAVMDHLIKQLQLATMNSCLPVLSNLIDSSVSLGFS